MDCIKSACEREPLYYHLYCTPEGGSCSHFADHLSTVVLGVYFFNKDFNCLTVVTSRSTSTTYLYVDIYFTKKGDVLRHFNLRRRFFCFLGGVNQTFDHNREEVFMCCYLWSLLTLAWAKETCVTGDEILGRHSLNFFFFLFKIVGKVKDIFRTWKSSGVL